MANKMQIKRGNKSTLPALSDGEFGYCMDSNELFIGNGGINRPIGAPTSLIADSGDGFIKYSDGTMICWGKKYYGNMGFPNTFEPLYGTHELIFDDFPVPFITTPAVTVRATKGFMNTITDATSKNAGSYTIYCLSASPILDFYMSYMAIGRWKA